ncbi:hypothetical protein INN71_00430 [Nocardioides sp. ChNu-153]|uniref:hypothetical protein n=1 Tax=unclassified Nocardioides TaxID=2615069 RepID=UPI0024052FE8|nr:MULTISPECIES: hypothetical protein [unclassified Nocardioides]MDF9714614.1 hypothetical protein [Nocardioides sp. ChNu-99]MDN7119852.1 hypothetical protein [Nocardioides sp. ChNu-153]
MLPTDLLQAGLSTLDAMSRAPVDERLEAVLDLLHAPCSDAPASVRGWWLGDHVDGTTRVRRSRGAAALPVPLEVHGCGALAAAAEGRASVLDPATVAHLVARHGSGHGGGPEAGLGGDVLVEHPRLLVSGGFDVDARSWVTAVAVAGPPSGTAIVELLHAALVQAALGFPRPPVGA